MAQLVFQDPYASLNPRMAARDIVAEPLEAMKYTRSREETDQHVMKISRQCQLEINNLRRVPHAFYGGQRQRISIAMALDASIQPEILALLKQLKQELGLTILFITHDFNVIANLCDSACVMKQGSVQL